MHIDAALVPIILESRNNMFRQTNRAARPKWAAHRPRVMAVTWLLLLAAWACAQDRPVAVVLRSDDGTFTRQGDELPLPLHVGEVLFEGDNFRAGDGAFTVLHCPSRLILELPPGAYGAVERKQIKTPARIVVPARPVSVCELPEMEKRPHAEEYYLGRSLFNPATPAIENPVSTPLVDAEAVVLVTRLALAQRENRFAEALDIANALEHYWSQTSWLRPRIFVHGQAVAATNLPQRPNQPQTFAVVVGISEYKNFSADRQLKFAHEDARMIYNFLRSPRGGALPDSNIRLLINEQATASAIRSAFNEFLKNRVGPDDKVIFFVASHGMNDADIRVRRGGKVSQGEGYLVAHDSSEQNPQASAVSISQFQTLLNSNIAHAGSIVVYIDACRSGQMAVIQAPKQNLFGLAASDAAQSSYEHGTLGHGIFSWYLHEALNGAASPTTDSKVTIRDLVRFVQSAVPDFVSKHSLRQIGSRVALGQDPAPFGFFDRDSILVSDLNLRGPFGAERAPSAGSSVSSATASGELRSRGMGDADARLDLEDRGQSVVVRYLQGEESPLRRDDFIAAAANFAAARRMAPESVWLEAREDFCSGRAAIFDKQYDRALRLLSRSVLLDPASAVAYNAMGIAYLEQADNTRALAAFEDAIRRAPRWAYAWHNKALAHTQGGDYSAAIRGYLRAMELAPRYSYLPYNLGVLYQTLNRRRDAEVQYRRAMELAPSHAEPHNALGTLYAARGNRSEAEREFRRALELNPNDPLARQNLDALRAEQDRRNQRRK